MISVAVQVIWSREVKGIAAKFERRADLDVERRVNRRERQPKAVGLAELDVERPRLPAVVEGR